MMLKFLIGLFLVALCACSNSDGIDVFKVSASHDTDFALKDRNPYGFICVPKWNDFRFAHDSVFLVQLDENLDEKDVYVGVFSDEHNWFGCDESSEFNFHSLNLSGPYVRFDIKGHFVVYDSVKMEATLSFFADMRSEDNVFVGINSTIERKRVEKLVREEAFPLAVARIVAEKEYTGSAIPFSRGNEEALLAYVDLPYYVGHLKFMMEDLAEDGTLDSVEELPVPIVDSVLKLGKMISDDFARVYELPTCNGDVLKSRVNNKESAFDGKTMICSNGFWRLENKMEDSLGACTSYNTEEVVDVDSIVYICDSAEVSWRVAELYEVLDYRYRKCSAENIGDTLDLEDDLIYICDEKNEQWKETDFDERMDVLLGACKGNEPRYEKYQDSLYYCNKKGGWEIISQMEFEIGKCGDDVAPNTVKKFDGEILICLKKDWEEASDSVVSVFSDSVAKQVVVKELDGVEFFCSGKKGCAFSDVDSIYDSRAEAGYQTIAYGGMLWMKGQPSVKYMDESGSFKFFENYVKDKIFSYNIVENEYYYTYAKAQEQCPAGFHVPDTTEWKRFRQGVDNEAIPDKKYTHIHFVLTPGKLEDLYVKTVSASWTSTRINDRNVYCYVDSAFVGCPLEAYPVATSCVMNAPSK